MTSMSTSIVRMRRSYPSVVNTVLSFAGAFELQYSVSLAETCNKDIGDDMLLTRHLPTHSRKLYVLSVEFRILIANIAKVLPLLRSLNEVWNDGKEVGMSVWIVCCCVVLEASHCSAYRRSCVLYHPLRSSLHSVHRASIVLANSITEIGITRSACPATR